MEEAQKMALLGREYVLVGLPTFADRRHPQSAYGLGRRKPSFKKIDESFNWSVIFCPDGSYIE